MGGGAQSRYNVHPITLGGEARGELLSALGIASGTAKAEGAQKAIDLIERAISAYMPTVENVNNQPRPKEYRSEYEAVANEALALLRRIEAMSPYMEDELNERLIIQSDPTDLFPLDPLATRLMTLYQRASTLADEYRKDPGGRPRDEALPFVVGKLCAVFKAHYKGKRGRRSGVNGAVEREAQLEFLTLALRIGNIPCDRARLRALMDSLDPL